MKRMFALPLLATTLLAQDKPFAPTIKFSGLVQAWATQMLDNNLRLNATGSPYSNVSGNFKENTVPR
jgi:hypothetical protein